MRKQTKKFIIDGFFMGSLSLAFTVTVKVNSAQQAKERFLKKYNTSFAGYWDFNVKDDSGEILLSFSKCNDDQGDFADDIPF